MKFPLAQQNYLALSKLQSANTVGTYTHIKGIKTGSFMKFLKDNLYPVYAFALGEMWAILMRLLKTDTPMILQM